MSKRFPNRYSLDEEDGSDLELGDLRTDEDDDNMRASGEEAGLISGARRDIDIRHRRAPKRQFHLKSICHSLVLVLIACMFCLGIFQLASIAHAAYVALFPAHQNSVITEWEQVGRAGKGLKHYPTDFTRDILPIHCHSHNDYWRAVPLYSGISAGCISTEADVWLYGSDLLVGHDESSLTAKRTLQSLYIDPLLAILERQNPSTDFADGSETMNGVFDTDVNQVFTLLIDLKTENNQTFEAVIRALEPLRGKGYLTHVDDNDKIVNRPIRVVGTGNTQLSNVLSSSQNLHKDVFFDAPIDEIAPGPDKWEDSAANPKPEFSSLNSYYASGSFSDIIGFMWGFSLTSSQLEKLRTQIKGAHEKGLKVRYWETPAWPVSRRNALWSILVEEGADILNVDDLKGAVEEDWRRSGRWW